MLDDTPDLDFVLGRFNKLIQELERGGTSRNVFQPWEIEILIDIEECQEAKPKRDLLRRYQKAAQRQLEKGMYPVLRLSEYLSQLQRKTAS
jgi:hypothetical protein